MDKLNFGISSWCYPWSMGVVKGPQPPKKMTWQELLNKAIEFNVDLVQFADNLPLEKLSNTELDELKSFAGDNKISLEVGTKGIEEEHLLNMLDIWKFCYYERSGGENKEGAPHVRKRKYSNGT